MARPLREYSAAVLLLASALIGIAPAQQAARFSAAGARPAEATYRIGGKVVDSHTGVALARCSVQIAEVKNRDKPVTVTSAEDGSFSFHGLPLGKYSLTAERRGYLAQSYEEHDQYSTAIAVGPGMISENLIFKLTAEAVLTGTITDEAGEPVRSAQVRLFQDQDMDGIRSTQQRYGVTTDDRGVYEFSDLKPGAYFLVVTGHPWYAHRVQRGEGNGGGDSNEAQALDVAYPTTFYPGVADQDASTPIPVKGGERLEASLTLAAQPAMRLHLSLPPDQAGRRNFSVVLNQTLFGQVETLPAQVTFGSGGSAEVEGVLSGHYDVTLSQFSADMGKSETRHFDTDVTSGSTELSDDSAVGEITVTGTVSYAGGKLPSSAGIGLRAPQGHRQYGSPVSDKGEFSISAPPGIYEVVGEITDMYVAGVKASGASLNGRILTLKAGDSPKLEIVAGKGFGEIEGMALLGEKPASAVMVLLAPEDPKNNQILFRRDQSDSDGTFDVLNIVPGRYRLLAIERGWELEWANPAVLQGFLAKAVPVEVKPGDHLKKTVEVQNR